MAGRENRLARLGLEAMLGLLELVPNAVNGKRTRAAL